MKKLFALMLALMCLMGTTALALEADDVFGAIDKENSGTWGPPYDHSVWKKMVGVDLLQDATITAKVYDEDGKLFNTLMAGEAHKSGYVVIN